MLTHNKGMGHTYAHLCLPCVFWILLLLAFALHVLVLHVLLLIMPHFLLIPLNPPYFFHLLLLWAAAGSILQLAEGHVLPQQDARTHSICVEGPHMVTFIQTSTAHALGLLELRAHFLALLFGLWPCLAAQSVPLMPQPLYALLLCPLPAFVELFG
jgi:hypothetical protein